MMKKINIKTIIFIFIFIQNILSAQSDCNNAILLTDTVYHVKQVTGYGKVKEFKTHELGDKFYFPQENKSIWYKIPITKSGLFYFDVIPDNPTDDWDFLVFKINKDTTCQNIVTEKIKPLRSNISRNNIAISGKTGLNLQSNYTHVTSGVNPDYCKALHVNQNDTLLVVINNYKNTNNGHIITWHIKPDKVNIPVDITKETVTKNENNVISLSLEFVNEKNEPLPVTAQITGLFSEPLRIKNKAKFDTIVPKKTHYFEVMAMAKGYMLTYESFKISKNKTAENFSVKLQPITKNNNVKLPNILFQPASDKFLPTSYNALEILSKFLKENPTVKIEIQGHVNGPGMPNTRGYKELSLARAKAVYNYLTNTEGIEPERLKYKGFGNTKMVYPDPKSEHESSMNRRVEIKILDF
jgi:outer membrane protein OmpA-like peptidoglycan-associated protein